MLAAGCGRLGFESSGGNPSVDAPRDGAGPPPPGDGSGGGDAPAMMIDAPPALVGDNCVNPYHLVIGGASIEADTCAAIDDAALTCGPAGTRDVFFDIQLDATKFTSITLSAGFEMTMIGPAATCMSGTLSCSPTLTVSGASVIRVGIEKIDGGCGPLVITAM